MDDVPRWVALARGLSEAAPGWVAWKSTGDASTGDLASSAPAAEWDVLIAEFRRWAAAHRLGPVITCTHEPYGFQLLALEGARRFFVLSVVARRVVRGATLFVPETLLSLTELDARGFRRLRPGAEAVILLLDAVADEGTEPDWQRLRARNLAVLAARDHTGVREASRLLLGPADRSMVQLVEAVELGRWDRRALSNLQRWCVARSIVEPATMATRVRHKLTRPCAVINAVAAGRRVPGDRRGWLTTVAADHVMEDPTVEDPTAEDPTVAEPAYVPQQLKPQKS